MNDLEDMPDLPDLTERQRDCLHDFAPWVWYPGSATEFATLVLRCHLCGKKK